MLETDHKEESSIYYLFAAQQLGLMSKVILSLTFYGRITTTQTLW